MSRGRSLVVTVGLMIALFAFITRPQRLVDCLFIVGVGASFGVTAWVAVRRPYGDPDGTSTWSRWTPSGRLWHKPSEDWPADEYWHRDSS